jgi:tetratricopeptide (TPR) repeat protein
MAWHGEHRAVLMAALRQAAAVRLDRLAWQLAWSLDTYSVRKGHLHDQFEAWQIAIECAGRLGELPARAHGHRNLAQADNRLGRYIEANDNLKRALELFTTMGDRIGQAHTQRHLAYLWGQQKQPATALGHARQALALFAGTDDRTGQAEALNAIGWYHAMLGEFEHTLSYCRQALEFFEADDDLHGATGAWDSLGYAHHHLGHLPRPSTATTAASRWPGPWTTTCSSPICLCTSAIPTVRPGSPPRRASRGRRRNNC